MAGGCLPSAAGRQHATPACSQPQPAPQSTSSTAGWRQPSPYSLHTRVSQAPTVPGKMQTALARRCRSSRSSALFSLRSASFSCFSASRSCFSRAATRPCNGWIGTEGRNKNGSGEAEACTPPRSAASLHRPAGPAWSSQKNQTNMWPQRRATQLGPAPLSCFSNAACQRASMQGLSAVLLSWPYDCFPLVAHSKHECRTC